MNEVMDSMVKLYPDNTEIKFSELKVGDKFFSDVEQAKVCEVLVKPYVETIGDKSYYKVDCNVELLED